jgi:hypothetical protein
MNCKERSQRFAIGSFHAFCSGCLKNKLTCTELWGYFFMGKERTVGRGGKEIDVWYDDILIPEPMTFAHVYYTFALHIYT